MPETREVPTLDGAVEVLRQATLGPKGRRADYAIVLSAASAGLLYDCITDIRNDAARLDYLLADDPRFRRYADGTWGYEADDDVWHYGASPRECIDTAMRGDGAHA